MNYIEFINEMLSEIENTPKQKVTRHETIPSSNIRLETPEWKQVDNVACVFVDLEDSTQIATDNIQKAMQFFTSYGDSLVKVFKACDAKYIDIQGDGGFALFDDNNALDNAFNALTTTNHLFNHKLGLKVRIGADIGTIYVKKVGIRGENKEVWLGNPVNIACKICNIKRYGLKNIRVTSKFFNQLSSEDKKFFIPTTETNSLYHSNVYWKD